MNKNPEIGETVEYRGELYEVTSLPTVGGSQMASIRPAGHWGARGKIVPVGDLKSASK